MGTFAENPYIFQTHDASPNKELFCGRTQDLEKIIKCLRRNESIALFGERRIGKTLVLYILRDLINDTVPSQRPYQLIDAELGTQWDKLCSQFSESCAIFIDPQDFPAGSKQASELFQDEIQEACVASGLHIPTKGKKKHSSLVELFKNIAMQLGKRSERLIVLVDEVENLKYFEDSQQVFNNLRSIIQAHSDRISFVFAGAEHWHQDVKYGNSPLANNLWQCYLKSPDSRAIRQFLIVKPLSKVLGDKTADRLSHDIIEITGGKPWFVQIICYFLWQRRGEVGDRAFDRIWQTFLRDEVKRQTVKQHLKVFYDQADSSTKQILEVLAVTQPLSVKQLARRSSIPEGEVSAILDDLEELGRVQPQKGLLRIGGKRYRFSDEITRVYWQERAKGIPKRLPWNKVLRNVIKWGVVGVLLIVALFLILYAYPRLGHHSVELPECAAEVWYPLSVEDTEEGNIRVVASNSEKPSAAPLTVTVSLSSAFVDYNCEGSNMLQFIQLKPGEKRPRELRYLVHPSVPVSEITTELTLASADASKKSSFEMQRRLPIKRHLIHFEALIVALAGLIARKEIVQLIGTVLGLVSTARSSESSTKQ